MEQKNHGVLVAPPRPTDLIFGANVKMVVARVVKDWSIYLPIQDSQKNSVADFLDCVSFSSGHSIEIQLNYLLFTGQFSDEALHFFHNNNYIKDGLFHISKRFNAKLSGTDRKRGNYLNEVGDSFRNDGFIPDSLWPMDSTMTWEEYYSPVPQTLIDLGKKALWFVLTQYQWVERPEISLCLKATPIQIATGICAGWDSGQTVQKCTGQPVQHATCLYGQDSSANWLNLDNYHPYTQKLASDYDIPYSLQYFVSVKPTALRKGMYGATVLRLQKDLEALGVPIAGDSSFGPATEKIIQNFQIHNGLVSDGIAGPLSLAKIQEILNRPDSIRSIITRVCLEEGIEPELGIAVASCEGGLADARKVNRNTDSHASIDRGIFQWNSYHHPEISEAQAFDPEVATRFFCKAVKAGKLHDFWSASEPHWKKLIRSDLRTKYGIV